MAYTKMKKDVGYDSDSDFGANDRLDTTNAQPQIKEENEEEFSDDDFGCNDRLDDQTIRQVPNEPTISQMGGGLVDEGQTKKQKLA